MNYLYFIILLLLSIILVLLYIIYDKFTTKWEQNMKRNFSIMKNILGQPTYIVPTKEGYANWKMNSRIYEIILYNEEIINNNPITHSDVVTVGIYIPISNINNLFSILSLSKTIWYNQLSSILYVRCSNLLICLESLLFIESFLKGEKSDITLEKIFLDNYNLENINQELYFERTNQVLTRFKK